MGISAAERSKLGQTSLEYLLLLAVVAVIVIASFSPGSLVSQVHDSAQSYYNSVSSVIMDSDGVNASGQDIDNPKAINGGWCPVTCPAAGNGPATIFGSCECPFPAFGGAPCPGINPPISASCGAGQTCPGAFEVSCSGVSSCSCPTGQTCNASGACVCGNGLVCGQPPTPTGSVPNAGCTQCICPLGTQYQGPAPGACVPQCPQVCTVWNGTGCVPETCPGNQYCDTTPGSGYGKCQCIFGTYWNGVLCVPYCTAFCQTWNGSSCAPTVCSLPNMYCNPNDGQCECASPYTCWNGSACVVPPCSCTGPTCACAGPTCSGTCCAAGDECNTGTGACCLPSPGCGSNTCGTDSCGVSCGTCPQGATCSGGAGNPGTCNSNTCTPTSCTVNATCGTDLGLNNCVPPGVCVGIANQCPLDAQGQQGTCDNGKCICGSCTSYNCASDTGVDACGNPCYIVGSCPSGQMCDLQTDQCVCQPSGICVPLYQCDNSYGYDSNCFIPCDNAPQGQCPTGETCSGAPSYECDCVPGACYPIFQCGSTSGFNGCGPCTATAGTCPTGDTCAPYPSYQCVPACVPDGSCTAPCGSTQGVDNCGNPCTTTSPGTTCPVGETCTSGQCVCTTPGICPTGAVCGPDTCGNANGCNGPNACPVGEICSSGQCVPNCLSCQTWNGSACASTIPCGVNDCGTDSCGNSCGTCPGGQTCSGGSGNPGTCSNCLSCQTWNGSACVSTISCGTNNCGTDSCGNSCGTCSGGQTCNGGSGVPGMCSSCLACQSWNGSACLSTIPCGSSQCGDDSCGNSCGSCPNGQTCSSTGPGTCVTCPNCAGAACGANDGCGGICQTGSCSGGGTCNAGQCQTTFTMVISDYLNCTSCAAACDYFNLQGAGSCQDADCGGQPGCPIVEGSCVPDPSGEGSDCGTCVSEAVTSINGVAGSGVPCATGIAATISQVVSPNQTYSTCGESPTAGQATVTYTVVCNP